MPERRSERVAPPAAGKSPLSAGPRAVLGLPLDAGRGEARRAFRRLAKQTHPDAGGDAAAFRAVAAAWSELRVVLPGDAAVAAARPAPRAATVSPHVRAYQDTGSRIVWAEPRPPAAAAPGRVTPAFATILSAEIARLAA
jgi:hypothetical protein